MTPLPKLYSKLCRELAQSEHSAIVHTRREARRLGDVVPARALEALGAHARAVRPRFNALMVGRQRGGVTLGRAVGGMVSAARHWLFDRMVDAERSYRGTLLGFHHGIAVTRLLRSVAARLGDERLISFCDDWLAERVPLVEAAERELSWFAELADSAMAPGLRLTVASPRQ